MRHMHLLELLLRQRGAHHRTSGSSHPMLVNCGRQVVLNHRPYISWMPRMTL